MLEWNWKKGLTDLTEAEYVEHQHRRLDDITTVPIEQFAPSRKNIDGKI